MKCPKCNNLIKVIKTEITNNTKQGQEYKEYNKTIYWCEQDDVWMVIEIPR